MLGIGDDQQSIATPQALLQESSDVLSQETVVVAIELDHMLFRLQPIEKLCA
jgi:hypothetical protein